ncbi:hypothetical protein [Cytobacillus horneckiae]|uniref:hypothetical protein n=1 Tax=Cytobacillus horneckiae TaxID=549687 RepID=UPI003D9A14DA
MPTGTKIEWRKPKEVIVIQTGTKIEWLKPKEVIDIQTGTKIERAEAKRGHSYTNWNQNRLVRVENNLSSFIRKEQFPRLCSICNLYILLPSYLKSGW